MYDPVVTAVAFFKTYYKPGFIANGINKKASPGWKMVPKDTSAEGKTYNFVVDVDGGLPTGSATLSAANDMAADSTDTVGSQFSLAYTTDYQPFQVSGQAIAASRTDKGAYIKMLKYSMDMALLNVAYRQSLAWHTQGWGEIGVLASVSGSTFKFADPAHIYRAQKGLKIVFASTLNTSALRSGTAIKITAVDYSNNLVTCDTALGTPGGANGDYVFTNGDRQNSSTPTRLRPIGFPGWIPNQSGGVTDTTLITIGGVNRASSTLLYGHFVDATAENIVDGLKQAVQTLATIGNADDVVITTSPANFTVAGNILESIRRNTNESGKATTGINELVVFADGGSGKLMADKLQSSFVAFAWDRKAFVHGSIGPAPRLDADDGRSLVRDPAGTDSVIGRFKSYECIACLNPNACANIALSS